MPRCSLRSPLLAVEEISEFKANSEPSLMVREIDQIE
jgi:hypothetical protein